MRQLFPCMGSGSGRIDRPFPLASASAICTLDDAPGRQHSRQSALGGRILRCVPIVPLGGIRSRKDGRRHGVDLRRL